MIGVYYDSRTMQAYKCTNTTATPRGCSKTYVVNVYINCGGEVSTFPNTIAIGQTLATTT